jgi:hypothetical protein
MNGRLFIGAASLITATIASASADESSEQASTSRDETALASAAPDAPLAAVPAEGFVFFPMGPDKGQHRWAVGGVWQVSPMFTANFRNGLGSGFAFDARATTIFVYNSLGAGATWAVPVGPFQLGLMAHVDGWFGVLGKAFSDSETSGFDSSGWGILTEPGAMAGLRLTDDSWITLVAELYLQPYQAQKLGSLVITPTAPLYSGSRASLVVEHSVGKGVIYYGASVYYTTQNFPIWFNVNYSTARFFYLGLLGGYEF